jgi:dihydrofolate reductase
MSRIALVVARAANGVIGNRGSIPWRIPEDMRRFKQLTMGKPCIMGRKTWESLPKKPLPGRLNIVVTRDPHYAAEGAVVVHSVEQGMARAESENPVEIEVIGGEEIYRATLPRADVIHLTEVQAEFPGDAYFPALDPRDWRQTAREEHVSESGLNYSFFKLERIHD